MKIRDSGMPEQGLWESLFDVDATLDRLGLDESMGDVVEFGCGYGTFSIPVARRIQGTLRTYDVDEGMVAHTRARAARAGLDNVLAEPRDLLADGFGLPAASQDACLLFNVLHHDDPIGLLRLATGVVRSGGYVVVTHWRYDPETPRGPDLNIRPQPGQVLEWAAAAGGLVAARGPVDLPPWHYGLVFVRQG